MPVSLTLKRRGAYTNLDYVEGEVHLDISSAEHIESITVKVEGISKTTVHAKKPGNERSKPKPVVEAHKLLYLQQIVWPDAKLRDAKASNTSTSHYTLQAGAYNFPFRLRLPVNNACQPPPSAMSMQNYHFTNSAITTVSHPTTHIKQTLPPSLGGIEDAWIRYFVKVTVNRPSFFSRNYRQILPFVFCPIEPPRPPPQNNQIFVRKKHTLATSAAAEEPGFLSGLFRKAPMKVGNGGTVTFEARLPNPPILVPSEPVPLTLILKRDVGSQGVVYIRSVQIMLGSTTFIVAQGFRREVGYLLPILNASNLNLTIPQAANQIVINPADLTQQGHESIGFSLPDTVPPTFRTCNIARKYTLVLQIGVAAHSSSPPEMIQLNVDIQVFSGFKPPPELLGSVTASQPPPPPPSNTKLDAKSEETQAAMAENNLPTYDEAVAETLGSPTVDDSEERRGRFEVEGRYLQNAENWDDEKR